MKTRPPLVSKMESARNDDAQGMEFAEEGISGRRPHGDCNWFGSWNSMRFWVHYCLEIKSESSLNIDIGFLSYTISKLDLFENVV